MSIRSITFDFLGRILGEDGAPTESKIFESEQRCIWMEFARSVLESYVVAALPLSPVRIYTDAKAAESLNHDAWLWNVSPNPNQSRAEFISALVHESLRHDKGALVVPVKRGTRTHIYLADSFTVDKRPGREHRYTDITIEGSTEVARRSGYTAGEVFLFRLAPAEGWARLNRLADDEYGKLAQVAEEAFVDAGASRYKLMTGVPVSGAAKQMDDIRAYMEASVGPYLRAQRGILPVYKDFNLERLAGASNAASWRRSEDVIAIRQDMFDAVASCFRAPASLIWGNTNNFDSVAKSFLTFGVDPLARAIEDEIARKTLSEEQWAAGGSVVVDTTRINHVDIFDSAQSIEKLVGSSIDSPNEIRILTRQRPVDKPGMDDYQRTKNNEPAGGGDSK
jgi:HK97 family phage portal protein